MNFKSKQHRASQPGLGHPYKEIGIALVTSMLILVVLTLIGLTMFRGFGLQQKIAGNTREKERSYQAAQNALAFAEWWLVNGTQGSVRPGTGSTCTSSQSTNVTSQSNMFVCSNAPSDPSDPTTWPAVLSYTPPNMMVNSAAGSATDGYGNVDINYSKAPGIYINFKNRVIDSSGHTINVYTVTAAGFGGSSNSTSVVQSVFSVSVGGTINHLDTDPINN